MEKLEGFVEHIIFRNSDNGYTVMNMENDGEDLTCVGSFPVLHEGEYIEVEGEFTTHSVYGRQLKVSNFRLKEPESTDQMEKYLGSGAIKGIGPSLAARIVRRFKEDTFRIIEEEPERLAEVKGISMKMASQIASQVVSMRDQRQALMFLQQYSISMNLAIRIYKQYGNKIYEIVQTNPYKLAEDMSGIGFKTADEIAGKVGIEKDSRFRIQSGILYVLMLAAADGHTYLPIDILTRNARTLLLVTQEQVEDEYMDLIVQRKLVRKDDNDEVRMYSSLFYTMESNIAVMLERLNLDVDVPEEDIDTELSEIEKETGIELDEMQANAVKGAVRNGLFILTGGPGTGKTTTINSMIHYFQREGLEIQLAAPTGRAAKRMSEMTGKQARTIHRMLELSGDVEHSDGFGRNEDNPLETDVIIIDEMSMVDVSLMHSLLKAIVPGTRLILVGDTNQLPSVGPGAVLKDIIESEEITTVTLSKIFRQAKESDIIVNAHKINNGEKVVLDNKSRDFFFLKRYDTDKIINVTLQLVYEKMPKYVDATPFEVQVLTPTRKGNLGVDNLNKILQRYINPPDNSKREKEHGDRIFREGDKVMQTKNNYQMEWEIVGKYGIPIETGLGVFNGDMGIIRKINSFSETMTIEFDDGKVVEYEFKLLDDLEHAYAITIHKSQGSEYPAVVIPLLGGPRMLLNRNLLYTAITRAKKCVVLVGSDETFEEMENNIMQQKRYSGLTERIIELKQNTLDILS